MAGKRAACQLLLLLPYLTQASTLHLTHSLPNDAPECPLLPSVSLPSQCSMPNVLAPRIQLFHPISSPPLPFLSLCPSFLSISSFHLFFPSLLSISSSHFFSPVSYS
ncbi:hypothetical protein CONLIGDRAFT_635498 [Coniochaeta ligniaria NRRL 30616]|uniref:Uncharacterized protein n=1 Tax=Coniochaeta ligniaria NRRL 30616 TaxID=1408157 RepID=A0A1J7IEH8_9PEZI|nr:hypothetical protein CONLIGDRAFT_635498 [Coniochaeta ligniaria NRRL 30616]